MAEPGDIVDFLFKKGPFRSVSSFRDGALTGRKVLITAGPTVEALDPVRYISNHSTGKMGLALAEKFLEEGASVTVVCGPISLPFPEGAVRVDVESALQMYGAVRKEYAAGVDVAVFCAAVADYRPVQAGTRKMKRGEGNISVELEPNPDIAAAMGGMKREGAVHVGFALETDSEVPNAVAKLGRKNLDMIVLNSLNVPGAGFGTDTNAVTMLFRDGSRKDLPLSSKKDIAAGIVKQIAGLINA